MGTFIRLAAFFGAMLVIAYGFSDTDGQADRVWLLLLLAAGVLLAVAWWPRGTRSLPVFNRTILRWSAIILVCFTLVSIQLVRVQIVESSRIVHRVAEAPNGETASNPRLRLQALEMQRGKIFDREGRVLADTIEREDGTYERTWPELSTAPLIGYYSPEMYGSTNIEAAYDEYLSGRDGGNPAEEWLNGILHKQRPGYDVRLTIDLGLQNLAAELMADRPGAVVLMDAETGEMLAMYGAPVFDPNQLYANLGQQTSEEVEAIQAYWAELNANPDAPLIFRPTDGLYNPGSTFKTVTASAIIDSGQAKLDTVFRDEGVFEVDGRIIEELNRPDPDRVNWTLEESYAYSLNVVFAQLGLQLGSQEMWDYAQRFGFGEAIPFDFDVVQTQLANSRDELNNRTLLADTGFGQGQILASPLQMAMVVAAAVNDGVMMQPMVVDRVTGEGGKVLEDFDSDDWRRAISGDSAAAVRDLLLATVEYGYSSAAAIDGLTVGGKTGTAEVGEGEPHSWFVGFAEQGERKLVVSVIVEHGGPGSQSALPVGRALLESAFQQAE
jgi:peptidoglycan glycosyltransferase